MNPAQVLLSATVAALALAAAVQPDPVARRTACPAGAVAPASLAGPSPQDAAPTATPIKHVVVMFNENVSFDHYFATYPNATNPPGEPAFTAAPHTPTVNNLANAHLLTNNPNATNTANGSDAAEPFRLDRTQANTADQNHAYTAEQQAYDGGKADLFPKYTGKGTPGGVGAFGTKGQVMGYFDGNTVTAMWHYAQHFAMSDNAYTDTYGPSTPGALNLVAGQNNGMQIVATSKKPSTLAAVSYYIKDGQGGFTMINDVDPGYDVCSVPADQAMMDGQEHRRPAQCRAASPGAASWAASTSTPRIPNGTTGCKRSTHSTVVGKDIVDYIPHHNWFQYYASTANPKHARPSSMAAIGYSYEHDGKTPDPANHEYGLQDFYAAVKAGNFPAVSFIKLPAYQDGHAGYSDPLDEQAGTVALINFLQQQPDWKNTAVIITWDDSDGWYDHAFAKTDQSVVRCRGGPARRAGQVRRGQAVGRRRRQAGERPLRPRHAPAVPGHLALGQAELCQPQPRLAGLGGALHRGQLAAWQAARRRLVRRHGRVRSWTCSTSPRAARNAALYLDPGDGRAGE